MNTVWMILSFLNVFAFVIFAVLLLLRAIRPETSRGPLPERVFHVLAVTFLTTLLVVIVPMFAGEQIERRLFSVLKILVLIVMTGILLMHKNTRQLPGWVPWMMSALAVAGAAVATMSMATLIG